MKIRKQYKNEDGTITEVEGTEEEIAKFEKKRNKKQDEGATKKKDILYGKEIVYVPYYVYPPPVFVPFVQQVPYNPPFYEITCTGDSITGHAWSSTTIEMKS